MNLLEVQKEALRRSAGRPGFGYFMEQGLGKTLTSFADFLERVSERSATRMLVTAPNSFKAGWVEDAEKHGVDLDFFVWEAGSEGYFKSWCRRGFKKPPCLIINWEAPRAVKVPTGKTHRWRENGLAELIRAEYVDPVQGRVMGIYDESIKAKTYNSAQTIGSLRLAKGLNFTRILSGKPISQGPHDLWAQMRLIKQLNGFEYHPFKNAFCKMGGFKNKVVVGAQNEDILAERIEPHVFRATKEDWTDLPPKLWPAPLEYRLTPEMKAMYDSMYNDFVLWLNDEENVSVDAAITKYIKLAQIQCGWVYDAEGKVRQLVPDERNPRLNLLKEFIDEQLTGKMCIVYHHKPVFEQLLRNLGGEDNCAWIKGGMTGAETEAQKRRFNNERQVRFILLQDDAAKYGHTLLGVPERGYRCYTMAFYENNYNLDTRSQIEDRPHRHGQTEPVSYIDFSGTPLDRDCVKALQRKEGVFQAVMRHIH